MTATTPWQLAGWTMLHFLWVGGAIGILAAILRRAIRDSAPQMRHAWAMLSLVLLVLAPGAIAWRLIQSDRAERPVPDPAHALTIDVVNAGRTAEQPPRPDQPDDHLAPILRPAAPVAGVANERTAEPPLLDTVASWLPWLWLTGSPLTFAWLAFGLAGAERLRQRSIILADGELPETCRRLAETLSIARVVAVAVCDRIAAPVLVGAIRPLIILPATALGCWTPEQIEMVLLHELAHVRRWDNVINLVQRSIESALFFHPAVWFVSGWLRQEREHCCDRIVVAHTGRPRAYAETLLTLAVPEPARTPPTAVAMTRNHLVLRIRQILMPPEEHPMKLSRSLIVAVGVAVLVPALWIAAMAQTQPPQRARTRGDAAPPSRPPASVESKRDSQPDAAIPAQAPNTPTPAMTPFRLVDAHDQPVAGAAIAQWFWRLGGPSGTWPPPQGVETETADARGEAALKLTVGSAQQRTAVCALRGDKDHPLIGLAQVTREEIGKPMTIVMHPACRIRFRAACSGFHELESKYHVKLTGPGMGWAAEVQIGEDQQAPSPLWSNSASGDFELFLPPGRFTIAAYGSDTHLSRRTVEIKPGERERDLGVIDLSPSDEARQGSFWHHREAQQSKARTKAQARHRPRLELRGDTDGTQDVAFTPDSKLLATADWYHSNPCEVRLWDTTTGILVGALRVPEKNRGVVTMATSPDSKLLAGAAGPLASPDPPGIVVLWDIASRRELRVLRGHTARIAALAFSPDGRTLVSGGEDKAVRFWDVATGRETGRIEGNAGWVRSVVFSPDGKTLAIGSGYTLKLWDVSGNRLRILIEPGGFWVHSVAYAPDGRTLAAAGARVEKSPASRREQLFAEVRLYDLTRDPAHPRTVLPFRFSGDFEPADAVPTANDIAFTPDGRRLAAVGAMSWVKIWDVASGTESESFERDSSRNFNDRLAFSPDGRWLAIVGSTGPVTVMDIRPPAP